MPAFALHAWGKLCDDDEAMIVMTWEQAVIWLRECEQYRQLIHWSYLDEPLVDAARRFAESDEWAAVRKLVAVLSCGKALDIGAGRGIASYALAMDGWAVTAVEPDRSEVVGAGAIERMARDCNLAITVTEAIAESLPFADRTFDLIYGRQVFHHVADMRAACKELSRIIKPGGIMLITREHVISKQSDLPLFLASHLVHQLCGGEMARLEAEYIGAIKNAGFEVMQVLGPWDSVINYYPYTRDDWRCECVKQLRKLIGWRLALRAVDPRLKAGRWMLAGLSRHASRSDTRPGRLFSFLARKSVSGSSRSNNLR